MLKVRKIMTLAFLKKIRSLKFLLATNSKTYIGGKLMITKHEMVMNTTSVSSYLEACMITQIKKKSLHNFLVDN